nr:merozoite surface protein CMZ-8-like [Procambarus clarkii]
MHLKLLHQNRTRQPWQNPPRPRCSGPPTTQTRLPTQPTACPVLTCLLLSSLNLQSAHSSPAPSPPHPPPSRHSAYSTPVSSPAHPAPDSPPTQHHLPQQPILSHPTLPPLPPLSPVPEPDDNAPLSPASNTDHQDQSQPQEDEDGGDDAGDEVEDQPQQQEENVPDEAEEEWLLEEFSAPLHNILHHPDWDAFTELLQQITTTMQEHFKIPTDGSSTTSTPIDVNDCAAI